MDKETFKKEGYKLIDYIADYFENTEQYPVTPAVQPGDIFSQLPNAAPDDPEPFERIFKDFDQVILPGMTHWQSPNFFAYFPSNTSYPSILADLLASGMNAQCMVWLTSPAAAELEEQVMIWLRKALDLPSAFTGVIQDTASTATLTALLTAREKHSDFQINKTGFQHNKFTIYASEQAHSSIDKAIKIAGFGVENLRKIQVDSSFAMDVKNLENQIVEDKENGYVPLCVIGALGTTGSTAVDPLLEIGTIAKKHNMWFHVDAAYAGTALLLPAYRHHAKGVDLADSFVFNPHKWMLTNFDCSAYFVKDTTSLINTFSIMPEYLKTGIDNEVNNYRDWGIQLGRRFRSLKLWFVLRSYGIKGLQKILQNHMNLAHWMEEQINKTEHYEILAPTHFNMVCFRYHQLGWSTEKSNDFNQQLMQSVNATGKAFYSHTKLNGMYTIRMCIGQTNVTKDHVIKAWENIQETTKGLLV